MLALAALASANLQMAGIHNAQVRNQDGAGAVPAEGPFDVIVLSGSTAQLPQHLLQHLKIGGRLGAIVGDEPMMRTTVVTTMASGEAVTRQPWDTVAPRLHGFAQRSRFVF